MIVYGFELAVSDSSFSIYAADDGDSGGFYDTA
jgi:hypothetical protein